MVLPVHVRPSSVATIRNCRVPCQFIGFQPLRPVAAQLIWLFQESLDLAGGGAAGLSQLSSLRLRGGFGSSAAAADGG